jgi:hypothetical protein
MTLMLGVGPALAQDEGGDEGEQDDVTKAMDLHDTGWLSE